MNIFGDLNKPYSALFCTIFSSVVAAQFRRYSKMEANISRCFWGFSTIIYNKILKYW